MKITIERKDLCTKKALTKMMKLNKLTNYGGRLSEEYIKGYNNAIEELIESNGKGFMMKEYICDGCKKRSFNEEDIPEYKMFVCETYDGTDCMLCIDCENKIKKIIEGKDGTLFRSNKDN